MPDFKERLKILSSAGIRIGAEILTNDEVISSGPEELLVLRLLIAPCISFWLILCKNMDCSAGEPKYLL